LIRLRGIHETVIVNTSVSIGVAQHFGDRLPDFVLGVKKKICQEFPKLYVPEEGEALNFKMTMNDKEFEQEIIASAVFERAMKPSKANGVLLGGSLLIYLAREADGNYDLEEGDLA
jgi:cyclopropane fatty-acyl-phospholipid synthase-like methyltransferase